MQQLLGIYEVELNNVGGLVMPVIIQWNYRDGTSEIETIPAEIWRKNERKITRVFVKEKEVASVVLDPLAQTTDIDTENNAFPRQTQAGRFDSFKQNAVR